MTQYFIEKNTALDLISERVERAPEFADRFAAISDLRSIDRDGVWGKTGEWKRVASVVGPVMDVAVVLDADFLAAKPKFYRWLDRHPRYCTYDRRRHHEPGHVVGGIVAPGPLQKAEA